jgi:hypothetical protein
MSDEPAPAPAPEIEVIYLGQRIDGKGKAFATFITPARLDSAGRGCADRYSSLYDPKGLAHLTVGGIYLATGSVNEAGKISTLGVGRLRFMERFQSSEVAEWELLDAAARADTRAAAQAKKLKDNPVSAREFKTLRNIYVAAPASLRPALELAVVKMLRDSVR